MSAPQPIWNLEYQRYLLTVWNTQYQRSYWLHHVDGQGWVFFDWVPETATTTSPPTTQSSTDQFDQIRQYQSGQYQSNTYPPNTYQLKTHQSGTVQSEFEVVRNPRNFFKIARVFLTNWSEPDSSGNPFTKPARFVVVKAMPTFSVCLRISTYSGQATLKPGVVAHQHAPVIRQNETPVYFGDEQYYLKEPIEIKVENEEIDVSPMSRINFAKPYTIEHNVKVKNIGRVVGESVRRLEWYLAEFLGFQVVPKHPTEYADAMP